MSKTSESQFHELLRNNTPLIDVRAPIEFEQGAIPGAINLPLLNDAERAEIGLIYKEQGQQAAIQRGHELVSGSTRESRTQAWINTLQKNPTAQIYCFRGGLRSQTVQQWVQEAGIARPIVDGGYKALRRFLLQELEAQMQRRQFIVVSGPTGAGKTEFLNQFPKHSIDLEDCAHHRGSAFGNLPGGQPSQVDFENQVALRLIKLENYIPHILIEDESRMIGRRALPESVFNAVESSPVIRLDVPIEDRIQQIHRDYVQTPLQHNPDAEALQKTLLQSLASIERKLGGVRHTEIRADIEQAFSDFQNVANPDRSDHSERHHTWIKKLLEWYYDPIYERGFQRRNPKVLFRGTIPQVHSWLTQHSAYR